MPDIERLRRIITNFGLLDTLPPHKARKLEPIMTGDGLHPLVIDAAAAIINDVLSYHEQYPLRVAPRAVLDGRTLHFGLQQHADSAPVTFNLDEQQRSTLIFGPTGSGKSTLMRGIIDDARAHDVKAVVVDPKPAPRDFLLDDDWFVFERTTPVNLVAPDGLVPLTEEMSLLGEVGAETLYAGEDYRQIIATACQRAFTKPFATMQDIVHAINALQNKGETYKFRDAQRGASLRHQRIIDRYPGPSTTPTPPLHALFAKSLYIPLQGVVETDEFVVTYIIRRLIRFAQCTAS